ncbi:MAG: bifunctional DNA-formamidopyrimidine glycosylase/DNA-(apurinic or apyrimidinic site) lyase [Bdellovibrionota bacterium]
MPELPEVETVVRQLRPLLVGRILQSIAVHDRKLAHAVRIPIGTEVFRVFRRAKYVVFELHQPGTSPVFLAVHLRMTGALIWSSDGASPTGETIPLLHQVSLTKKHLRFELTMDGGKLRFYDPRRFGTVELFLSEELVPCKGLEPFSPQFTDEELTRLLKRSKQRIKTWLLRQDRLVGIGNIYASEILFEAGIAPGKRTDRLKRAQISQLRLATLNILERAIENCGTSFSDFRDATGSAGGFQQFLRVYEREGELCRHCSTKIKRVVEQQRSTYYCPQCQR